MIDLRELIARWRKVAKESPALRPDMEETKRILWCADELEQAISADSETVPEYVKVLEEGLDEQAASRESLEEALKKKVIRSRWTKISENSEELIPYEIVFRPSQWERVEATLAAHDQKVRAEVLEEAAHHFPYVNTMSKTPYLTCGLVRGPYACGKEFSCVREWCEHIRALALPAKEKNRETVPSIAGRTTA